MGASDYLENKLVDHLFRSTPFSKPPHLFLGLFTLAPGDAGGGSEVSGGSYARAQLDPLDTNWTATQGGTSGVSSGTSRRTSNAVALTFPTPTADWGVIDAWGLFDAVTGGNLLLWDSFTGGSILLGDYGPLFDVGALRLTIAYTNFLTNGVIDHLFRTATFSPPAHLWIALYTVAPTDAGGGTEVTGGSYARVQLDPGDANWESTNGSNAGVSSGTSGRTRNLSLLTFPAQTADWGRVVASAILDASSGGNLIAWTPFTVARDVLNGDPAPKLPIGALTIVVDNSASSGDDIVTILTSTSTATLDDFNAGALTTLNVLRMNNATVATIRGLTNNGATPTDGTMVWVEAVGAGQVDIANQNAGSAAGNRVINNVTATISLAAGSGRALLAYDGTTGRWRVLEHEQGAWIAVPYSAGNFTSNTGTWTVGAGDQTTFAYYLKGRLLSVACALDTTTVASSPSLLQIAIPGGFIAAKQVYGAMGRLVDNNVNTTGYAQVNPSGTLIKVQRTDVNAFAASTDQTYVWVNIAFEVQ